MPSEQGERRIDHPAGKAAVSRRAVMRAALGTWLGTHIGSAGGQGLAQAQSATPSAGQTVESQSQLNLPAGITAAGDADSPSPPPASGGALRLVRPGETLGNFNPSAFRQDPQIPLSYLEPLVRPDPTTMRPTPWLAQRGSGARMAWSSFSCSATACIGTTELRSRLPMPRSHSRSTEPTPIPRSANSSRWSIVWTLSRSESCA